MIIIYKCYYCDNEYRSKRECRKHEKTCIYRPDMRACETCGYRSLMKFPSRYVCSKGVLKKDEFHKAKCEVWKLNENNYKG